MGLGIACNSLRHLITPKGLALSIGLQHTHEPNLSSGRPGVQ